MAAMERYVDKAIVLASCLAAAACFLVANEFGGQSAADANALTLPLAACMLAAIAGSAAFEALPAPLRSVAPAAYCAFACFSPSAALFAPLAVYDFMRTIHEPGIERAFGLAAVAALVASIASHALPDLALATLLCATAAAAALSARTSSALARQTIARRTRDALKSQALDLRRKNQTLAEALEEMQGKAEYESDAAEATDEAPTRPAAFACLTEREWEVARLVAEGLDNREIAAEAYLSEGTVRNNISAILSKMGLKNRTQIAVTFWKSLR